MINAKRYIPVNITALFSSVIQFLRNEGMLNSGGLEASVKSDLDMAILCQIRATTLVNYYLAYDHGGTPVPISEDEYNQLIKLVREYLEGVL